MKCCNNTCVASRHLGRKEPNAGSALTSSATCIYSLRKKYNADLALLTYVTVALLTFRHNNTLLTVVIKKQLNHKFFGLFND